MNTLSHLTICSKSGLQISQSLQSLFCRFHTHGSLRICVCVCRLLFQQKRLTWSSCNQTTLASGVKPRTSTSHPVGSEGLDDVQEVFSRAQPVSQVFQPCTERLGTAMRRRCNASSKLEQMSNSRTRPPIARGPWRLQRVWDAYPSAFPPWPLEKRVAAAGFTYNK